MSAEQELRDALQRDLYRHADQDVHMFAGFMISWVTRNVPLTQVEELADQLDAAHPGPAGAPGS
ncbi:hypothetical protein [Kribbella shirazensis]|uniref:Uncharacterized protein n=1 Tax=Kribbella shirazensis TaxID=1105143 RepID=A0A7X5VCK4_9ACTN|nr:hypothetical protein [Kribbella shirazensis]NIK57908.1 hypothetical protein [Kribbella shirazensis]